MELREIRVVHYGLGAIGSIIARLTSEDSRWSAALIATRRKLDVI